MDFDPMTGNLNWRSDQTRNLVEEFDFDNLDRLKEAQVDYQPLLEVGYLANGNIAAKSDAGEYAYLDDKIHAVKSITNPNVNISLVTQDITYTTWGRRTATINEGIQNAVFTYGPDNERKKLVMTDGAQEVSTRSYKGSYEVLYINGDVCKLNYVGDGDGLCANHVMKNNEAGKFFYTFKDHLGSILTLTDDEGNIEGEQSFDAWGRYRDPATWEVLKSNPADNELVVDMPVWMSRGYTGHSLSRICFGKHMKEFDLINMNGWMGVYPAVSGKPTIGRMLAPDNYVADPYNTQAYNRLLMFTTAH